MITSSLNLNVRSPNPRVKIISNTTRDQTEYTSNTLQNNEFTKIPTMKPKTIQYKI